MIMKMEFILLNLSLDIKQNKKKLFFFNEAFAD